MCCYSVQAWLTALGPWITGAAIVWIAIWQRNTQKRSADFQRESDKKIAEQQARLTSELYARQLELEKDIADRQADLDAEKIRLDLFEKRFVVWLCLRRLFDEITCDNRVTIDRTISQYAADIREARWLFDQEIVDYLNTIFDKAANLRAFRDRMINYENTRDVATLPAGMTHKDLIDKETELTIWFTQQATLESAALFSRYLSFRKVRA